MPTRRNCGTFWTHDYQPNGAGREVCTRCAKLNPNGVPRDVRFWDHVQKTDTCWDWIGSLNGGGGGYGKFTYKDENAKGKWPFVNAAAHRYSYKLLVGEIPDGLEIDHLCHRPICVNPAHMRLVTHRENMAARRNAGKCRAGHVMNETQKVWDCGRRVCGACYSLRLQTEKAARHARGLKKVGRKAKAV